MYNLFNNENILWTDDGPHFVDLDDCRSGPAVQDLWMMLSGDRQQQLLQLDTLLSGYEEFYSFEHNQLVLIDPAGVAKWQIMPKVIDQSKFRGPYHVIQPNKGDMIIFPSWMYHSVQTNAYYKKRTTGGRGIEEETIEPAVTVAMNLSIVGEYGDKDLHTFNENI